MLPHVLVFFLVSIISSTVFFHLKNSFVFNVELLEERNAKDQGLSYSISKVSQSLWAFTELTTVRILKTDAFV